MGKAKKKKRNVRRVLLGLKLWRSSAENWKNLFLLNVGLAGNMGITGGRVGSELGWLFRECNFSFIK